MHIKIRDHFKPKNLAKLTQALYRHKIEYYTDIKNMSSDNIWYGKYNNT